MSKPIPVHASMDQFDTSNNQILVGGKTLDSISTILDKSVFYAYDKSIVKRQIERFHQAIPKQIKLHYAIKANPYLPLVNAMRDWVEGFDVASQNTTVP